ncbi:MAG: phosphodiester glycosidase family protein [Clostridia bacterium]|nr:phosphodiester glycosidase family protein [Clostridia bacterium]
MQNTSFKRVVSCMLVALMLVGIMPLQLFAAVDFDISDDGYYKLISKKDWEIAPGISESEIVLNNDAGTYRQVIHVMEADLNNEYVKVINSYNGMVPKYGDYKTGTMSEQAAYAEANGYGNVVGAMNTTLSWYTGYSADRVGEPLGFIMLDAEILFDPANCGYTYGKVGFPSVLVINKDFDENGNPRPDDIPKVEMPQITSAADLDGWEDQVIPCSSGYILKNGVVSATGDYATSSAPRSVVGIKDDGTVVIMENDGRQTPYSEGMNLKELAEVMADLGCSYAVNCDGGGTSTFLSQRPGEELKVNNSPSDGSERPTTSGILFISTAPANGEFVRAHITTDSEYYTPGSNVVFNAVGTDAVGTTADIPEDVEWQLVDESFGTIENGIFTSNGKEGKVTAQMVYNGNVVGEASITIVLPDISFKTDTIVIGYGDSIALPIEVTTNDGFNTVAYEDEDIVYTLSDENLGTINGDMFTACDESTGLTGGTVTAVICGQTDKAVTAEIRFGKASEIAYDFEDGEFLVDVDPEVAPAEGEPYGWFIRDTRANGHFAYRFFGKKNYTPVGMDIPAQVYLVDRDSGMVRNGNYAMGVDIDWTNVTASCHGQMDLFLPESLDLTDATKIGFWMYIPAELVTASMNVNAGFRTTDGGSARVDHQLTAYLASNTGIDNGGWYYFSWDVLDTYSTFEYIQINSHYTAGTGSYNYYQDVTYYIDDITVDYSDATIDRENPYFTSMTIADDYTNGVEVDGQTITTNTIDLMAQAYENTTKTNATGLNRNSVKLYVDGVQSTAAIFTAVNGTIAVSDLYLNDGVHTLVMEISDNQGNVGNIVRKLVVNTDKSAVRLEVPAATGLIPTGSIYWLNLVADNLADVDSVTTTINLDYVNDWELEGMEVAYGFEAEYYINNHNDAVITFTRTGTEIADTTVLAKLPVRIWMAKGWMDDSGIRKDYISNDPAKQDKYYILTPHAMWYSDGTRDYRLVVGAEAGVVTYTDGTTETFSANETVLQTEMNRYYTNANRQNKWSFHICTPGEAESKAPTCTETGYANRVFCTACACGSVENLGAECDTHNGCGSVIDWGTTVPATGHIYTVVEGVLACACGATYTKNGLVTFGDTSYYVVAGNLVSGWQLIEDEWYYFDTTTYANVATYNNGYVTFEFEATGKLISGQWYHTSSGSRYYYGPTYYTGRYGAARWYEIDGKQYCFPVDGYCYKGIRFVDDDNNEQYEWYDFGTDGAMISTYTQDGPFTVDGKLYYVVDGLSSVGLRKIDGAYYYFTSGNYRCAVSNTTRNCDIVYCDLPAGTYTFGADGKMVDKALQTVDGVLYYFELGNISTAVDSYEIDGVSYVVDETGKVLYSGLYTDAFGVENYYKDGVTATRNGLVGDYYYIDGVRVGAYYGLVEHEGDFYYVNDGGKIIKNIRKYVNKTNGLTFADGTPVPQAYYDFDADGKMVIEADEPDTPDTPVLNGLVGDHYYINGVMVGNYYGLVEHEGNFYYVNDNAKIIKDVRKYVNKTNGLTFADGTPVPQAYFEFDEDGKMIIEK